MSAELVIICEKCRCPVPPEAGCLWVGHREIRTCQRESAEWDREHSGQAMSLTEMLGMPEDIHWKVHHDGCTPEPEEPYWIGTEGVATWTGLAHWTAHLMEKNWFPLSDWDNLLRELGGEGEPTRIRAVAREAA